MLVVEVEAVTGLPLVLLVLVVWVAVGLVTLVIPVMGHLAFPIPEEVVAAVPLVMLVAMAVVV
jgi:hypothetical protein